MNAKTFLDPEARKTVEAAIAAAEKRTAAEIVCAVATESGRYDRAESIIGVLGSLLALLGVNALAAGCMASGSWSSAPAISLLWQMAAVVVGFILGSLFGSRCPVTRKLFTCAAEMNEETAKSSAAVFAQRRLGSTRDQGAILLYVSLFERQVRVLADDGAMKACGQPLLDRLRDLAVERLKAGKHMETFTDSIAAAADELAQKFPVRPGDTDEISNALLIFHPRP